MAATITYNALRNFDAAHPGGMNGSGIFNSSAGVIQASNLAGNVSFNYFPNSPVVGDALYFEAPVPFNGVSLNVGTPMNGTVTLVWEYLNTSGSWIAFTPTDGTGGFKNTGARTVTFPITTFTNWGGTYAHPVAPLTNSDCGLFIRCRISAISVQPTVGGSQSTSKVQYRDATIIIDGYSSGSPATPSLIYSADQAGGWGVVTKIDNNTYKIMANVHLTSTGHLSVIAKSMIIGSDTVGFAFTSAEGPNLRVGQTTYSGANWTALGDSGIIIHNNVYADYEPMCATIRGKCGIIRQTNTHGWLIQGGAGQAFYDAFLDLKDALFGITTWWDFEKVIIASAPAFLIKANVGGMYLYQAEINTVLKMEPNSHALLSGSYLYYNDTVEPAAIQFLDSTEGPVNGFSLVMIDNKTRYTSQRGSNTYGRSVVNYNCTFSINFKDPSGNFMADVRLSVHNTFGSILTNYTDAYLDPSAAGHIDKTSWGNTSFDLNDGTLITIGSIIRVDYEFMKITGISGNTATVDRAQFGTLITKHNTTETDGTYVEYVLQEVMTTGDEYGVYTDAVLQADCNFGINTPGPYNTGVNTTIQYGPIRIKARKYGYVFMDFTMDFNLSNSDFVFTMDVNPFVSGALNAVSGYTGISINGESKSIIISENHTIQELYDYSQFWAADSGNMVYDMPLVIDLGCLIVSNGWRLVVDGCVLSESSGIKTLPSCTVIAAPLGAIQTINGGAVNETTVSYPLYCLYDSGKSVTVQCYANYGIVGSAIPMTEIDGKGIYMAVMPMVDSGLYYLVFSSGGIQFGAEKMFWDGQKSIVHADLSGVVQKTDLDGLATTNDLISML